MWLHFATVNWLAGNIISEMTYDNMRGNIFSRNFHWVSHARIINLVEKHLISFARIQLKY